MRIAALIGGAAALTYGWIVTASVGYCLLTGHMGALAFPYLQWLQVIPYRNMMPMVTLAFWASAAVPAFAILLGAGAVITRRIRRPAPPLYGETQWAGPEAMRKGGIRLDRRPW